MGGRAEPVPREVGTGGTSPALRVDTYQAAPPDMARFAALNPFHFDRAWRIPVPAQPGRFSSSIEAVWQGLKVHDGVTDFAMFDQPPYKRPPDRDRGPDFDYVASRFRLGDLEIGLVAARLAIYLPTYLFVLERLVPGAVIAEIFATLSRGADVYFYDWDDNFDILDPRSSFSHSAVLAAWFNGTLDEQFLTPWRELLVGRPEFECADLPPLDRYRSLHQRNGVVR
jgi:hypothetical protein